MNPSASHSAGVIRLIAATAAVGAASVILGQANRASARETAKPGECLVMTAHQCADNNGYYYNNSYCSDYAKCNTCHPLPIENCYSADHGHYILGVPEDIR